MPLSFDEVASRAGVQKEYVRGLTGLGALEGREEEYVESRLGFVRVSPVDLKGVSRA